MGSASLPAHISRFTTLRAAPPPPPVWHGHLCRTPYLTSCPTRRSAVRATNARAGSGGGGEAAAAAGYARAATIEPFRRVDVTQAEDQSSGSKAAEALAKALREQGIDLGSMASQVKLALDIDTNTGDVVEIGRAHV